MAYHQSALSKATTERKPDTSGSSSPIDEAKIRSLVEEAKRLSGLGECVPHLHYFFNFSNLEFDYLNGIIGGLIEQEGSKESAEKIFLEIVHPEDRAIILNSVLPEFKKLRKEHSAEQNKKLSFQMTYRIVGKDGSVCRVLERYRFLEIADDLSPVISFGQINEFYHNLHSREVSGSVYLRNGGTFDLLFHKNFSGLEDHITKREKEVLYHLVNGLTSAEIGELLHISKNTVNRHRQNITSKLELDSPKELIKHAIINGIY